MACEHCKYPELLYSTTESLGSRDIGRFAVDTVATTSDSCLSTIGVTSEPIPVITAGADLINQDSETKLHLYCIPLYRFILLFVFTFGLYSLYWFYVHWTNEQNNSKTKMHPFTRSVLSGIYIFSFCLRIEEHQISQGHKSLLPLVIYPLTYIIPVIVVPFLLVIAAFNPGPYVLAIYLSLYLFPLISLAGLQHEVNWLARQMDIKSSNTASNRKFIIRFLLTLLLFVGYSELKGLASLKDTPKDTSKAQISDVLAKTVEDFRKKLPMRIDEQTMFTGINAGYLSLTYQYQLDKINKKDMNIIIFENTMKKALKEGACTNKSFRDNVLKYGVTVSYSYVDRLNQDILKIDISENDCNL